jgi:hypothetical protein
LVDDVGDINCHHHDIKEPDYRQEQHKKAGIMEQVLITDPTLIANLDRW